MSEVEVGALDLEVLERRLHESALAARGAATGSVLSETLDAGGKRVRALLISLFGELCGADPEPLMELALAVEMLHAATLIHDDIIDAAPTRRGRAALHAEHGSEVALLVGDLYVARCGVHLAAIGRTDPTAEVYGALDSMVRGELEQRGRRFDLAMIVDEYMTMVQRKTASLIEAACASAVAIAPEATADLVAAARAYGGDLGLAFQIVDDVLDYTGTAEVLGKPAGHDIREGSVTLPLILTLELSPAPVKAIMESARASGDFSAVLQAVRRSGAVERCLQLAQRHAAAAVAHLGVFPESLARSSLQGLAAELPARRR